MNQVSDFILSAWTSGRHTKRTGSGWITSNAPCCHNRGYTRDTRGRGGLIQDNRNTSYHCFNCGFKASYDEGALLNSGMRTLLDWMGADFTDIGKMAFLSKQLLEDVETVTVDTALPTFKTIGFPKTAMPLKLAITQNPKSKPVLEYVIEERGLSIDDYNWYWDSAHPTRLMIPYYKDKRLVGWTLRSICGEEPRYINTQQSNYVFNMDQQSYDRKYTILVEGPIDAISIEGIAMLGVECKEQQINLIKTLETEIIVVPDRDKNGKRILQTVEDNGWSVSMPDWYWDIKDVNDAVKKYGKVYTIHSILKNATNNKVEILKAQRYWFQN